jgi:hypothetical protein
MKQRWVFTQVKPKRADKQFNGVYETGWQQPDDPRLCADP